MASILVPVLYLTIVVGGLLIFSYFYRKRAAAKRYEPWFPPHRERDTYITLLQLSNPPASDALLKAALVRRAMTDVTRVLRLREDKPALQNLMQKGSVSDDFWNSLLAAEKELEAEILEVMHEANSYVEGWGQLIFNTAGEMVQNEKQRRVFDEIPAVKAKQEAKYGKKRKASQKAQIPNSSPSVSPATTPDTPGTLPSASPSTHPTNGLAPPTVETDSVGSSDGELVSTPSRPARPTPSKSSSKKGKKRK